MFFRRKKLLLTLIAFLVLVGYQRISPSQQVLSENIQAASHSGVTPTVQATAQDTVHVSRVVDGDTIEVLVKNKKNKVRVIGINTPETVDPRRPVQCFGKEASAYAKQLLTGQDITLVSDPTQANRDKYGRLLRYIFINGTDFGKTMIAQGYAHEYTYDIPYQYQEDYKQAEKQARQEQKGLWANAACSQGSS